MLVPSHLVDDLADASRRDSVLFGNVGLLVAHHDRLVGDAKNLRVGELGPALDPFPHLRCGLLPVVTWLHIIMNQARVLIPSLQTLGQPVYLLQVSAQTPPPGIIELQSSLGELGPQPRHELGLHLELLVAELEALHRHAWMFSGELSREKEGSPAAGDGANDGGCLRLGKKQIAP